MTRSRAAKSSRTHVGLEQRFVASIRSLDLRPGQPIVLAFSGGKDSLALAQLFARTGPITGVKARLLHVNHNLRPTSSEEAVQATALAKKVSLPIAIVEIAPNFVNRHLGLGVEEAARRERYLALRDYARKRRTDILALAHQQQDQAESVLLHLLRGAGISGMQAMSELTDVRIPWWEGTSKGKPFRVWRPLLNEDPEELASYLRLHQLSPINDPSNDDPEFRRNRIRHEVLPVLETIQPKVQEVIARFAKIAALEDAVLASITDEAIKSLAHGEIRIDRLGSLGTHPVFLRRLFKGLIERAGVTDVRFDRVEQVVALVKDETSDRIIELGGRVIAVSDDNWIYLGNQQAVADELQSLYEIWLVPFDWAEDQEREIRLDVPVTIEGVTIHASADPVKLGKHRPWRPRLPAEAFSGHVVLRKIRNGDLWARSGATIREQLRITGIPPVARTRLMVFASDQGVWLIPGVSRSRDLTTEKNEPLVYIDIQEVK
jgi:tRNA(Ile)-lysidine synthase